MRARIVAAAGAFALVLAGLAGPASAGALKVLSVDQRGMVVVDKPTIQRSGDRVTATLLTVSNRGYLLAQFYEIPIRAAISVDCADDTYSLDHGATRAVQPGTAVARATGWLCKGVAPDYAVESGDFGELGHAYLAYVAITPGVFIRYTP